MYSLPHMYSLPQSLQSSEASLAASADTQPPTRLLHDAETALVLGHHVLDFWTNICVCHSLIVHENPQGGLPLYQGTSPDEVALLDAARQLGFTFVRRSLSNIVLNMRGHNVTFEILNVMDFTSDRGRMSVIARAPDGACGQRCQWSMRTTSATTRHHSLVLQGQRRQGHGAYPARH